MTEVPSPKLWTQTGSALHVPLRVPSRCFSLEYMNSTFLTGRAMVTSQPPQDMFCTKQSSDIPLIGTCHKRQFQRYAENHG